MKIPPHPAAEDATSRIACEFRLPPAPLTPCFPPKFAKWHGPVLARVAVLLPGSSATPPDSARCCRAVRGPASAVLHPEGAAGARKAGAGPPPLVSAG